MKASGLAPVLALLVVAAAQPPSSQNAPYPNFNAQRPAPPPATEPQGFTLAPTPNADSYAPVTRASKDASVAPGFFTRRDQYRGEGLSPGSSAQIEQDRRVRPGAGINLTMPLQ